MDKTNSFYIKVNGNYTLFSAKEYLRSNIDVRKSDLDPYSHWQNYGHLEHRKISFCNEFREFENQGYFIIKNSLENEVIDDALNAIKQFKEDNIIMWKRNTDINGYARRITSLHRYNEKIMKLFSGNLAARFADYIFNDSASIYTSLYFEAGSEQSIHRDTPYFHTKPVNKFLGFWVALEDINFLNGPLKLVPKGHKSSEIDVKSIALEKYKDLNQIDPNDPDLWDKYQKIMYEKCLEEGLSEETIEMKKGDTLIWHPMLPHGGSRIIDQLATRNSIVFHVTPENMPVYKQDYFFNPDKYTSSIPEWNYINFDSRQVANISDSVLFPLSFDGKRDKVKINKNKNENDYVNNYLNKLAFYLKKILEKNYYFLKILIKTISKINS